MALNIALYGYDTDIGKLIIETLEEQDFSFANFFPLSPLTGEYDAVQIKRQNYFVEPISKFDFSKADIALFISTQDETSQWVKKAQESGCIVLDNSHLYSGDGHTLTLFPELNEFQIKEAVESRLVIPPLAPSLQLALPLSVLDDEFGVVKVTATSLESVSEQGRLGTETLAHETTLLLNGMSGEHDGFPAQLAFNLHTHVGNLSENNYTEHENTIRTEVQQVIGRFEGGIDVTTILVPIFYGHTQIVHVELDRVTSLEKIEQAFNDCEFVTLCEKDQVLTPVTDSINERSVLISRLRQDTQSGKSFSFVSLMDNSRRGEAISCVNIVKLLAKYMQK